MLKSACSVQWLTCVRSKAVGVRFAVLVLRMLFESRLLGGALERLEADLALDCLSGGIRLQLTLCFFLVVALAIALLLCLCSVAHVVCLVQIVISG